MDRSMCALIQLRWHSRWMHRIINATIAVQWRNSYHFHKVVHFRSKIFLKTTHRHTFTSHHAQYYILHLIWCKFLTVFALPKRQIACGIKVLPQVNDVSIASKPFITHHSLNYRQLLQFYLKMYIWTQPHTAKPKKKEEQLAILLHYYTV